MYELKCPSCEHLTKSSFVRMGAVVCCPSCEHTYRVADAHVSRQVRAAVAVEAGDPGEAGASDLLPAASGGDVGGRLGPGGSGRLDDDSPVQGEPIQAEPMRDEEEDDSRNGAARQRMVLAVAGGVGGVLVVLILVLWLATGGANGESVSPAGEVEIEAEYDAEPGHGVGDDGSGAEDQGLRLVDQGEGGHVVEGGEEGRGVAGWVHVE